MGLRKRTLFIFVATIAISATAAIGISRHFYLRGYGNLEELEARSSMLRALALIEDDLDQLNILVRDWASWDDTYEFLLSGTTDYAASNLGEDTFESLGLSAIVFLDVRGAGIFSWTEDGVHAADDFAARMEPFSRELPVDRISGLLRAGDGLHLAVARPVLRSDGSGPGAGLLMMARPLNSARLDRYGRLLGLSVSLDAGGGPAKGPEELRTTEERITVTRPLPDIGGASVAALAVSASRGIYRYGSESLVYYLGTVAAAMGAVALAAFLILEALVFRSVRSIGTQLNRIASGAYPDARLTVPGGDEVGAMAEAMNRTLEALHLRIREREAMLREIHHRVKNNLQIIASLSSLQMSRSESEAVRAALQEGRRRVMAMALVHNELYDGSDLSRIDLGDLIRSFLGSMETNVGETGPIDLQLELPEAEFFMDIDGAVPLGLILSEVLSNAYRHAFPGGRGGSIRISAGKGEAGTVQLEIADDGIGIAPPASRRDGLGLTIVESLATQLEGHFDLGAVPAGGTRFSLSFPLLRAGASREQPYR